MTEPIMVLLTNKLSPVLVSLSYDLVGKLSVLKLSVKCKLVLWLSIRDLVDPRNDIVQC